MDALLYAVCDVLHFESMSIGAFSYIFFFFKQKTAYEIVDCDWSSDVCSSDLLQALGGSLARVPQATDPASTRLQLTLPQASQLADKPA